VAHSPCLSRDSRHSYSVGLLIRLSSHDCSCELAPRKSFDILALYKSDYYYIIIMPSKPHLSRVHVNCTLDMLSTELNGWTEQWPWPWFWTFKVCKFQHVTTYMNNGREIIFSLWSISFLCDFDLSPFHCAVSQYFPQTLAAWHLYCHPFVLPTVYQ